MSQVRNDLSEVSFKDIIENQQNTFSYKLR